MRRPCIGLTVDLDGASGEYRLSRSYADAVLAAGGLPIPIPHGDSAAAGAYLALCQGLVVTGGAFDVPPHLYGEERRRSCGLEKPERTRYEWSLCEAAFAGRLPVLGICGGMQLMNVVRGGTLHQDLSEELGLGSHEQRQAKELPSHDVRVVPDTLLARLVGCEALPVNSTHHQAVCRAGAGVLVSALAPDRVVEAIEIPDLPFALGVQWHPERLLACDARHLDLWRGLVAAAKDLRR